MLHHSTDDSIVQQQMAIIDDLEYATSAKATENKSESINCFQNTTSDKLGSTTTTTAKIAIISENINNNDDGNDVIELDSSPEKNTSIDSQTLLTSTKQSDESINLLNSICKLKENLIKMQPLEKVRETISKNNEITNSKQELKEQGEKNENSIENDQNKENVENNEIQNQHNGKDDKEIEEMKDLNNINEKLSDKSLIIINENDNENDQKQLENITAIIKDNNTLELMDVSENSTIIDNKIEESNENKDEIKIEITETNEKIIDIRINDISKTPELATSITTSNSSIINRKRLRSRSHNEDNNDTNISNNVHLTSTPLVNHEKKQNLDSEFDLSENNNIKESSSKTIIETNSNNYNNNKINNDDEEQLHPAKKLRAELETNFTKHDRILAEYIERTTNDTADDVDKHISQLAIEIQTLNDMIKAKEFEWNNMLHLKKVKEEICFRLTRKKQVMELMATRLGEITNHIPNATTSIEQNLLGEKLSIAAQLKIPNITNNNNNNNNNSNKNHLSLSQTAQQAQMAQTSSAAALAAMAAATSNLLNYSAAATTISAASKNFTNNLLNNNFNNNSNNNNINMNSDFLSSLNSSTASTTQNILQSRANMKSSDLAKEKTNAQKIHRLLVSRNILPKPTASMTSASLPSGISAQQLQQKQQQLATTSLMQNIGNGGGASVSQLAGLSGIFGSATSPVVMSTSAGGGGAAVQIPLPLSNVATGSLMSAHTPPGTTATVTSNATGVNHQPTILNNYLTAAASVQQQLGELFNGHHNPTNTQNGQNLMVGRQGVFKDVKSIIADYRQRHPEQVPRRGRRMKSTNSNDVSVGGSGHNRLSNSELNNLLNRLEANSRPSSNDSSSHHSLTNVNAAAAAAVAANLSGAGATGNISFKDVLVQFAKMSGQPIDRLSAAAAAAASAAALTTPSLQNNNINNNNNFNNNNNNNSIRNNNTTTTNSTTTVSNTIGQNNSNSNNPSTFPEVTLHPVSTTNQTADQSGSLLHGILTKYSRGGQSTSHSSNVSQNSILSAVVAAGQQQNTSCAPTSTTTNYNSTFSPTLARLLTAPERITNNLSGSQNSTLGSHQTSTITAAQAAASNSSGLNLTKVVAHNNEITITPVMSSNGGQQSVLQHTLLQKQIKDALNITKNYCGGTTTNDRIKSEYFMNIDDEADDSVDRLVIDEGGGDTGGGNEEMHRIAPNAIGQEFHENEVPWCQGCKNQEAQFVCAGCGNQWYCSRQCQVQAWDEHSEICTG